MTIRARNRALVAGLIGLAALAATLLPMVASSTTDHVRDIHIVMRDMSFYVDGRPEPNPAISVRAGQKVRIHVRNEDAGMRHDFTVSAWTVATRMLEDKGEEDAITFRVPQQRGDATYTCTPHSKMMSGTLRVE